MELLQVVPGCVASLDSVEEADHEGYVTVEIRRKCKCLRILNLPLCMLGFSRVTELMDSLYIVSI
jgi:hypothetical protein